MTDLNFITDGVIDRHDSTIERIRAQRARREEILRECFKHDLKLAFDYAEAAMDHCRDMIRAGFETKEELAEARVTLEAFLVAVMAMQRESA